MNHVVDKYGVRDDMTFGMEMVAAEWMDDHAHWRVTMRDAQGKETVHTPDILISGA